MEPTTLSEAIAEIRGTVWAQDDSDGLEALESFGSYTGLPPRIILLADGRNATLIDPIAYHAADTVDWPVPANAALNGASIPQAFWSLIGGPFEGKYRDASIVHDYYCDHPAHSWQDTARMFYAAMRCSEVGIVEAKIMFYAVFRFGPRWPDPVLESPAPAEGETANDAKAGSVLADVKLIAEQSPSLDRIENIVAERGAD
jgi:endonuclease G